MTTNHDGHGGSYLVGDNEVKKREGTLNPGDAGYAERVKREPVADREKKGTLNRLPSFRDLEEKPAKPAKDASKVPMPVLTPPAAVDPKGGK
jgi:hypothetical protein